MHFNLKMMSQCHNVTKTLFFPVANFYLFMFMKSLLNISCYFIFYFNVSIYVAVDLF